MSQPRTLAPPASFSFAYLADVECRRVVETRVEFVPHCLKLHQDQDLTVCYRLPVSWRGKCIRYESLLESLQSGWADGSDKRRYLEQFWPQLDREIGSASYAFLKAARDILRYRTLVLFLQRCHVLWLFGMQHVQVPLLFPATSAGMQPSLSRWHVLYCVHRFHSSSAVQLVCPSLQPSVFLQDLISVVVCRCPLEWKMDKKCIVQICCSRHHNVTLLAR